MTLKDHALAAGPGPKSGLGALVAALESLAEPDLIALRHEIDSRLVLNLEDLNLAEEQALQYQQAKALLQEVQGDRETPANQKAQVFSAVRAQLDSIVKQMDTVWGIQRMKVFEAAFLKCLRHDTLTDEAREAFFELYSRYIKDPRLTPETVNGTPSTENAAAVGSPQA